MPSQTIDILMYGMRRSGKSSVLASMINSFREAAQGTSLELTPTAGTAEIMRSKLIALEKTFYDADYLGQESFVFSGDLEDSEYDMPSYEITPYQFDLSYHEAEQTEDIARLTFWDVPGEVYQSREQDMIDEIEAKMRLCNILIIAVDTVHLMEESGKYSQAFHSPRILKNLISRCWVEEEGKIPTPKMVLFVPLKSEKYYWLSKKGSPSFTESDSELTMDMVIGKIKETFQLPIDALQGIPNPVTVAITPILTMGSVEFDHFGRDESGKIMLQQVFGMKGTKKPRQVHYHFTRNKDFCPLYCEQPVLYVLAFIVRSTEKIREIEEKQKKKRRSSFIEIFMEGMLDFFTLPYGLAVIYMLGRFFLENKNFMSAYDKVSVKLKKSGDGYLILHNTIGL